MIVLVDSGTSNLRVVTTGTGQVDVFISYKTVTSAGESPTSTSAVITTATTTTVLGTPSAGTKYVITHMTVTAVASNTVSVGKDRGGTLLLFAEPLAMAAGARMDYTSQRGWRFFDADGTEVGDMVKNEDKGDITVTDGPTWTINPATVTNSQLANQDPYTLKGNADEDAASPSDLTNSLAWVPLLAPASAGSMRLWGDQDFNEGAAGIGSGFHWKVTSTGGTPSVADVTDSSGTHGLVQLSTGATSGNDAILYYDVTLAGAGAGAAASGNIQGNIITKCQWDIVVTSLTSRFIRLGYGSSPGATGFGADACYIQYDGSAANWFVNTRVNSVGTSVDSGVAVSVGRHRLTICRISGEAQFWIDNQFVAGIAANLPTSSDLVTPAIRIISQTAGAKAVNVDRCQVWVDD